MVLVNVNTMFVMIKSGEDMGVTSGHIDMICKNALTRVYKLRIVALISYDKAVRSIWFCG